MRRDVVPGRGQPPGDQSDAKGVWFEFPFEVLECLLRKSFQAQPGEAGRSSDRHLTVGLDATRRQRASRAEPEQHAGCP